MRLHAFDYTSLHPLPPPIVYLGSGTARIPSYSRLPESSGLLGPSRSFLPSGLADPILLLDATERVLHLSTWGIS